MAIRLLCRQTTDHIDHLSGMIAGLDALLNVPNDTLPVYNERRAVRNTQRRANTVGRGGFARGVAEDGVARADGFGKVAVFFRGVGARGKVGDVQLVELFAAIGERFAFAGTARRERAGIPRQDHGPAA